MTGKACAGCTALIEPPGVCRACEVGKCLHCASCNQAWPSSQADRTLAYLHRNSHHMDLLEGMRGKT